MASIRKYDKLCVATLRALVLDETNAANSGHPGMALGSAPILHTLFTRHLVSDPTHPDWINRDRFILSSGHLSSLLYAICHVAGYNISLDDLKKFRQSGSKTPGHPELLLCHEFSDCTSGPLGQGIGQAVGEALAETYLAADYPKGKKLVNHYTYCLCGDGCLEEGISQEAISYAGLEKLNKLILLYDNNDVTLDGPLSLSSIENTKKRFKAAGWNVYKVKNGNNINAINRKINKAKSSRHKPSLIIVKTKIGYGTNVEGTSKAHGSPLGEEEARRAKVESYKFDHEDFFVPEEVYQFYDVNFKQKGIKAYQSWDKKFNKYAKKHKGEGERFSALAKNDVSKYLPDVFPEIEDGVSMSTRTASSKALNDYMLSIPTLIGGSADVAASTLTKLDFGTDYTPKNRSGHNLNFGIREFGMASIMNGALLHGGVRMYGGCFLVFSDYMKPAIRMAAMSHLPAIYLFSHDSIAVGEDGPTHQPVEQLAMLRSIPNVNVIRPCDERETYGAWYQALKSTETPTAIILSRQDLPVLKGSLSEGVTKGAYILSSEDDKKDLDLILIASGSEVSLAVSAQEKLKKEKINTRVVSMPSMEIFEKQTDEYKKDVLPLKPSKTISVEMLSSFGWDKYAKYHLSVDTYGESGKAKEVIEKYGFSEDNLVNLAKSIIKK